jgi:ribosomal protein S18 acetylase RimI-like enzyme
MRMAITILPYSDANRLEILSLSLRAWAPVFEQLEPAVQPFVYQAFYPEGWQVRQSDDIAQFLDTDAHHVWVAFDGEAIVGWVGIRLHHKDTMGEIYILAVDPEHQQQGVGSALLDKGFDQIKAAGMTIVMVETGDDPGHAASRATYERKGFTRWPVARYFREL